MVCAIQLEWIFLQHVIKGTGRAVENLIREKKNPCLFFGKSKSLLSIIRTLSTMPVKKSGLGLQDLVTSSNDKYLSLICTSRDLIGSLAGESEFSTTYNLQAVKEERCGGKKSSDVNDIKLEVIFNHIPTLERSLFIHAKDMGSCLTVWGTTVTGKLLAVTEFCGFFFTRSDVTPPNFQKQYDG